MQANEKKLNRSIVIAFILISLPVFILSFYNVPSADDYTFGRLVKAWVSENGYDPLGILWCGVQNSINYYFNWQGRYSESFFASFMPDIFGCYWIWTIFLYSFFMSGIVFLFYTIARNAVGKEYGKTGACIGLISGIAVTQNVPFPVEAWFWFDGSMAYMFHHVFYIWMCAVTIKYFFLEEKKSSVCHMTVLAILTILAAGGNNVTSFISILTYLVFLGAAILLHRKRGIVFPFALSVCGFLVSYLSPGTTIRGGDSSNYSPILLTIRKCFVWTIKQYLIKWTTLGIILMLVFLTPLLLGLVMKIVDKYNFKFPFPLLLIIGDVCFISAMSCPSFYVLGEPGPGRLRNIIYVNFVVIAVLTYSYILGWISARWKNSEKLGKLSRLYEIMPAKASIPALIVMLAFLCVGNFQQFGVTIEAVTELVSGQASQYYREASVRKELYMDPELSEVEVSPYSVKPYLLYFDDITDDPENWKNNGLCEFYGKDSVKLNQYDPDVDYD